MKKEVLCTVYGDVQGVFFRQFAKEKAGEFGIVGTATNMENGMVEVVAQGEEEALKKFVEAISVGPENAQVESMDIMWGKPTGDFSGFSIH